MSAKTYADPVVNFSVSCDPSLLRRLNDYATKKRTTRSWIVRKALTEWLQEHDPKDIAAWSCLRCFSHNDLDSDQCDAPDCTYIPKGPHLDAINRWRAQQ